jgi:hypothetical protein
MLYQLYPVTYRLIIIIIIIIIIIPSITSSLRLRFTVYFKLITLLILSVRIIQTIYIF